MFAFLETFIPFFPGVLSFLITYFMVPEIIKISHNKNLLDEPTKVRKFHAIATPYLGGIAIFATVTISFSLSGSAANPWVPFLIAGMTILFMSGLKDDILIERAYKKLITQIIASFILILGSGYVITNLGGMFGVSEIPYWAGLLLTVFTLVVVINAFNLIDGVDGLASGLALISAMFYSVWFYFAGMHTYAVLAFVISGALLAFLKYNFQPATIFLGDTGSQIIGYLVGFLAIVFTKFGITAANSMPFQESIPVLAWAVIIVPLYDTLRVFVIRLLHGRSPFSADRLHIHHQLRDRGISRRLTCVILYGVNVVVISIALLFHNMEVNILAGMILGSALLLFPTSRFKRRMLMQMGYYIPLLKLVDRLDYDNIFTDQRYDLTHRQYRDTKKEKVSDEAA